MYAAEKDDVGFGLLRLIGKAERIAHKIGHALDRLDLVIVREDDGVAFAFQTENFLLNGGEWSDFATRRGDDGFVIEDGGHVEKSGNIYAKPPGGKEEDVPSPPGGRLFFRGKVRAILPEPIDQGCIGQLQQPALICF